MMGRLDGQFVGGWGGWLVGKLLGQSMSWFIVGLVGSWIVWLVDGWENVGWVSRFVYAFIG